MHERLILRIKIFISDLIYRIFFSLKYAFSKTIIINGYLSVSLKQVNNHNFGDDLNFPLLRDLTGKNITFLRYHFFRNHRSHLLCIGSIIDGYANANSVIWGAGIIDDTNNLKEKPAKVYSVRGKLTKKYLDNQGIYCPAIFGDPALLLPYIYQKQVEKKFEFGFIPHVTELNLPHVLDFQKLHPEIKLIRLTNYSSWMDIVDQILSCHYIVSSSLHGLIVSDAYRIPNVYVKLSNLLKGGDLKFRDYYSGVDRQYLPPIDFSREIDFIQVRNRLESYKPIQFDPIPLLRAFPYKITRVFEQKLQ